MLLDKINSADFRPVFYKWISQATSFHMCPSKGLFMKVILLPLLYFSFEGECYLLEHQCKYVNFLKLLLVLLKFSIDNLHKISSLNLSLENIL